MLLLSSLFIIYVVHLTKKIVLTTRLQSFQYLTKSLRVNQIEKVPDIKIHIVMSVLKNICGWTAWDTEPRGSPRVIAPRRKFPVTLLQLLPSP